MTVIAVLQARFSSSRLPGKVLKPILGKPIAKFSNDYEKCSSLSLQTPESSMRCSCSILQKSLTGFYHE
jgi:hypothetical protein